MPNVESAVETIACPGCGRRLNYRAVDGGRRGVCTGCRRQLRLPVTERTPSVGFPCRVCNTRLSAAVSQVGRKVACPDCGTKTVVPPPTPVKPPQTPAAMGGEQYELWGVDEAPLPAELLAAQPRHFPVECRLCRTLMYAVEDQLGTELACPDCGAKTLATAPSERATPAVEADGDEYELDEASAPTPRPVVVRTSIEQSVQREEQRLAEQAKSRRPEARERPPRVPLLQGVAAMLVTSPVLARWVGLSAGLMIVAWFAGPAVSGAASQGGFGAIYVMCFLAIACILGVLWFGAAAAVWIALVTESADGHDRLHDPPSVAFFDWIADVPYVAVAAAASLLPGWAIHTGLVASGVAASPFIMPLAWLVCFPLALLSALEQGSPMAVFAPKLAASLWRASPAWLLFYAETFALWAAVAWTANWLVGRSPGLAIVVGPLAMAATFAYFRLLGRLAWWLGEWLAEADDRQAGRHETDP